MTAPFTQGSLGRYRARGFFDTLKTAPTGAVFSMDRSNRMAIIRLRKQSC